MYLRGVDKTIIEKNKDLHSERKRKQCSFKFGKNFEEKTRIYSYRKFVEYLGGDY